MSNAGLAVTELAVGLLLIERARGGAIGPLLFVAGVIAAIDGPLDLYTSQLFSESPPAVLPGGDLAAVLFLSSNLPASAAVITAMFLFPDGRLLAPALRWVIVVGCVATVVGLVAWVFGTGDLGPVYPMYRSPFAVAGFERHGIEGLASVTVQAFRIVAVATLLLRWRSGGKVLRAQTTWVLAALALQAAAQFAAFVVRDVRDWTSAWTGTVVVGTGILLPIAMGIAIIRFRLFDIDRIVSRTIAYAAISVVLAASYVGASVAVATILGADREGEAISVAVATLVVATAFSTLRGRVQRLVDRRFDRARYDGVRAIDGLAERLRGDVELDRVRDDVLVVVDQTVHPAHRTMWLRPARDAEPA
jgi:hypothetical protein